MPGGFPNRPNRDDFGPESIDTRPVVDARREISAGRFNLAFHQLAGSGLLVPRAAFHFTADDPAVQLGRVEAWNPSRLTTPPFDDPGITRSGVGRYVLEYTSPVTDQEGNSATISFQWAMGFQANADPSVLKHVQASVVAANPNQVDVAIRDSALALEDGNDVVILMW